MKIIGKKMKELRLAQDWTLADLAKKSGVALSTLSRVENGQMTGTLESHLQVAKALGVRLAELYAEIDQPAAAEHRARAKADRYIAGNGAAFSILTSKGLRKKMLPVLVHLGPKKSSAEQQDSNGTEKFLYVLQGTIEVTVGKELHRLTAGDSLYFQAALPHHLRNAGSGSAQALSVSSPPAV